VPADEVPTDKPIELDIVEATLQLSLKTKIAQNILGKGTFWLAYTQKSF
jgi:phospholipase A1